MANEIYTTAEEKLLKKANTTKVREIDFVEQFVGGIKKLQEVLNVSRMIPVQAGTTLYTYKAKGTLESGEVAEGAVIPLSQFSVDKVAYGEAKLKKWRKATSAEAIIKSGFDAAVGKTDEKALRNVQNGIRKDYFTFLGTGTATATGVGLQPALANGWGKLRTLFEDDAVESIYFLNPMDVATYLGTAQITTQTVFGMTYIKNFLGMGDVLLNSTVPEGKYYATAKENVVIYYVPANGENGLGEAFEFTTDETGLVGIHEQADYDRLQAETIIISGVDIFAERLDGVINGTIASGV